MQNTRFNPLKYIKEKGKSLPIEQCLISDLYKVKALTICLIIRRQPSGKFTFANVLVDRLCMGVKQCYVSCNETTEEIEELKKSLSADGEFEEVTPEYFHNMIYGAVDYAADLGFTPPKDFEKAEHILDDSFVTDGINEIEMGWEGKPLFLAGPVDDADKILATLRRGLNDDEFDYVLFEKDFQ